MKLLFENWRQYMTEQYEMKNTIYYWQTKGSWTSEDAVDLGQTHVPQAKPREQADGLIEEIFEEVRKESFPDRPSRLNCVYLCDNLEGFSGGSFCSYSEHGDGETYEVELHGDYKIFKTNSEYWTEAVMGYFNYKNEDDVKRWAKTYWEGDDNPTFGEILVSPPEAAIIVEKYLSETPI